jgi:hypothetical protein
MSSNNSYTRKSLMHGERIVYSARGHFFNYFYSILAILLGLYLTGIFEPKVPDKLKDSESFQEISKNIDKRMEDVNSSLAKIEYEAKNIYSTATKDFPDEVKGYMHFLAIIRTTYFGVVFLFLGSVNFIRVYIKSKTNEYCVTNKRVIFKYGFLTTDTNEVSLDRIEGVKIKQTMTDKIVGRGNVLINGVGNEQVEMRKISEPAFLRKAVLEAVNRHAAQGVRK